MLKLLRALGIAFLLLTIIPYKVRAETESEVSEADVDTESEDSLERSEFSTEAKSAQDSDGWEVRSLGTRYRLRGLELGAEFRDGQKWAEGNFSAVKARVAYTYPVTSSWRITVGGGAHQLRQSRLDGVIATDEAQEGEEEEETQAPAFATLDSTFINDRSTYPYAELASHWTPPGTGLKLKTSVVHDLVYMDWEEAGSLDLALRSEMLRLEAVWEPTESLYFETKTSYSFVNDGNRYPSTDNAAYVSTLKAGPAHLWLGAGLSFDGMRERHQNYWSPAAYWEAGPRAELEFPVIGRLAGVAEFQFNRTFETGSPDGRLVRAGVKLQLPYSDRWNFGGGYMRMESAPEPWVRNDFVLSISAAL